MTQKQKLMEATMMAQRIRSIATRIGFDAKDYDVRWPLQYVDELNRVANDFLKLK